MGEWKTVQSRSLPELEEDEVQLWRADVPTDSTGTEEYLRLLSVEEQARAGRMRQGSVRMQFVSARACLRTLLGSVLAIDPMRVPITASSFGKPETPGIFYNVAHSGRTILIALCRHRAIGVDVEYFSRSVEALEIAKNSFAANEYRELSSIGDDDGLRRAFFRCWTRKEAVVKADGRGLSAALDTFEVPVGEMSGGKVVSLGTGDRAEVQTYIVRDIECGRDIAAAYAVTVLEAECAARSFLFPRNLLTEEA